MSRIEDDKLDEAISNATDMVNTVNIVCGSLAWIPGRVRKLFDTACIYYERANFICTQLRVLIPAPPFHPYRWVQFMVEKP